MANTDITSPTMDGIGPHGTRIGLLRVLGRAHAWALGVGLAPGFVGAPGGGGVGFISGASTLATAVRLGRSYLSSLPGPPCQLIHDA